MAVRAEQEFVIIPRIKHSWIDMYIQVEDKCATLYGKDKEDSPPMWTEKGDFKNYEVNVLMGCAFEQSRSDHSRPKIFAEGVDDDGNKYLIIDRREKSNG